MVIFTLTIGFFDGYAKDPDAAEVEGALCELKKYIDEDLRHALVDEEAKSTLYLIQWTYKEGDAKPVSIEFAVQGLSGEGQPISASSAYEKLKLDANELKDLIENYMWNAPPAGNIFHDTSQMAFEAIIGTPNEGSEMPSPVNCLDDGTRHSSFSNFANNYFTHAHFLQQGKRPPRGVPNSALTPSPLKIFRTMIIHKGTPREAPRSVRTLCLLKKVLRMLTKLTARNLAPR
jgi:hypothetical protein